MSQEIGLLVSQAREGKFTSVQFCKALERLAVNHTQRMLYVRDAFGLSLEQAKRVVLEADGGSIEAWTQDIGDVINDVSAKLREPDDQ